MKCAEAGPGAYRECVIIQGEQLVPYRYGISFFCVVKQAKIVVINLILTHYFVFSQLSSTSLVRASAGLPGWGNK
ncbi:hypothetical protein ED312_12815 [Sinomicrobium pectinilyticum]|uniref:Uncharacterized protein n=1 Tax=Sinomicrobium pectinilyticum TaxID=1084421 RepID=A0A3N0EBE9_SINP1|nr:hypothetical protein ED312_12815 [Sinomicrobium pectinilyticum]